MTSGQLDFIHDRLVDGRQFKCLAILDEYTQEILALVTGRLITGDDVLSTLIELITHRGMPNCIRSDNGLEFISKRVKNWLNAVGVRTLFIEPGAPWQNGYVESFNSRFRDEFLNMEIFNSLKEVQHESNLCCCLCDQVELPGATAEVLEVKGSRAIRIRLILVEPPPGQTS